MKAGSEADVEGQIQELKTITRLQGEPSTPPPPLDQPAWPHAGPRGFQI